MAYRQQMEGWAIKYVLEIEKWDADDKGVGGRDAQRMVIPLVSSFQRTETPSTVREWTLGRYPVKQKMGYREARISISGVAGNVQREGYTHLGATITARGEKLFDEFDKFLRGYELEGAATEGPIHRGRKTRLIFRSMDYGTADFVEIERYQISRNDGSSRMMTSYSLELVTEGPVKRGDRIKFGGVEQQAMLDAKTLTLMATLARTGSYDGMTPKQIREIGARVTEGTRGDREEILGLVDASDTTKSRFTPSITKIAEGVQVSSISEILDSFPVTWSQLRSPVKKFREALQSVQSVAGAVRKQLMFPRVVLADFFDTASDILVTLESLHDAIPGAANREDARQAFYDAYAAIESTRVQALSNLGASGQRLPSRQTIKAGTGIHPSVQSRNGVVVTTGTLQAGDTLPQFAARELGDPELWREIMELNGMASPYEAANGVPLYGGLTLFIPYTGGVPQLPDLFGTDLRFKDGDLVYNGTTDFALISGPPNYQQAISRRLSNIQGDNEVFPLWAMPKLVGEPGIAGTAGYISSNVVEQCEADPRTKRVEGMLLTSSGDTFDAEFALVPVVGQAIQVIAPLPG